MKYLINIYVFILACNVLYSSCLLVLYGNCYDVVLKNSKKRNVSMKNFHRLRNKNHRSGSSTAKISRIRRTTIGKMYDDNSYCSDMYIRENRMYYQTLESSETYDTLKQSDIVSIQNMA